MKNSPDRKKVVIIGGGFAGIEAMKILAKKSSVVDVTLVSSSSCFQYYPSLYRLVVGATTNQVSIPLEHIVPKKVKLVIDTYTGIDEARQVILLQNGKELSYDYVVMALGSEPNYFGIDGMEAHSKSFLSVQKAVALNQYFLDLIAQSRSLSTEEAKKKLHTIIVGAGPSGVELAGALRSYLMKQAKKQGINPNLISVDLLDSGSRILPAIPEHASALVAKRLQKQGVTMYSNYGVNACDENCITVANKATAENTTIQLEAGTVIWTAGTKINTAFNTIPHVILTDRKRITVSNTLTLPDNDKVYIAGDGSGTPYSGLAQTAIDQGQYVAKAILNRISAISVTPYVPKPGIFVIPVGKGWAILNKEQFVASGLPAWLIRIMVDAHYFLSITSVWHVLGMLVKKDGKK